MSNSRIDLDRIAAGMAEAHSIDEKLKPFLEEFGNNIPNKEIIDLYRIQGEFGYKINLYVSFTSQKYVDEKSVVRRIERYALDFVLDRQIIRSKDKFIATFESVDFIRENYQGSYFYRFR